MATENDNEPVHYFRFDPRFCGTRKQCHRVTVNDDEVTCERCLDNTPVHLTEQGKRVLRSLGYMDSTGKVK